MRTMKMKMITMMKTMNKFHLSNTYERKKESEDTDMNFIEGMDYRMVGRTAYFSNRYKQMYFTLGSKEQVAIDRFRNEHKCLIKFASDQFIQAGEERRSTDYWTGHKV